MWALWLIDELFRIPDINIAVASSDQGTLLYGLLDTILFTIAPMLIDVFVVCGRAN